MSVVSIWLDGCGLGHAIPNFTAAGIVTPDALAELELDYYEALGISSPEDRRKLFYLVQRIKLAVRKEEEAQNNAESPAKQRALQIQMSLEAQVEAVIQSTTPGIEAAKQSHGESTEQKTTPIENPTIASSPSIKKSRSKVFTSKSSLKCPSILNTPKASSVAKTSVKNTTRPPEGTKFCPKSSPTKNRSRPSTTSVQSTELDVGETNAGESTTSVTPARGAESTTATTTESTNIEATQTAGKQFLSVRRLSSGLKTPQTKSKLVQQQTKPSISNPSTSNPSRTRVTSKLQNPSKSMRTGKPLSVIPSEDTLSMSPLVHVKLDQNVSTTKPNLVQPRKMVLSGKSNSSSSRSIGASINKDASDSDASNAERSCIVGNRRHSASSRRSSSNRPSVLTGSDSGSDSSVNSSKRRRSMGLQHAPQANVLAKGQVSDVVLTSQGQTFTCDGKTTGHPSFQIRKSVSPKSSTLSGKSKLAPIHQGSAETSFGAKILSLREEVNKEHMLFNDLSGDFGGDEDHDGHMIHVIVRKRPLNKDKQSDVDIIQPLEYADYGKMLVYQPVTRVDLTKEINKVPFSYDSVFGEEYDNAYIYNKSVRNLIPVVLDGQHATVFAFGATGSGKTHTMMGSSFTGKKIVEDRNMGLYYMAALDVFACLEEPEFSHLSVCVSLFEIYGGKLFDLLSNRKPVKCLEDHKGKVQFPGLSEHNINSPSELIHLIELGAQSRSTGTTSRNADSSRSHAVLQLRLKKSVGSTANVEHGRLTFIDLAGSERGADTANFSRATRLEGAEINTSLLALKEVIRARARGGDMVHVPFRGSKLTQVLKESFVGENSRCLMIACIAPDMDNCEQTLNTLRYADRVKERNPETGDLPAKFSKRGGRRRISMLKPNTSFSSIVSSSEKGNRSIGDAMVEPVEFDVYSDCRSIINQGEASATRQTAVERKSQALPVTCSEDDDTEALLDAVLSDDADTACLVSNAETKQSDRLARELAKTQELFLKNIEKMVVKEIDLLGLVQSETDSKIRADCCYEFKRELQNQVEHISDVREIFRSTESLAICEDIKNAIKVLSGLLDVLYLQLVAAKNLQNESNLQDLSELQSMKISKVGQLEKLSVGNEGKHSILDDDTKEDGDISENSFEDLRA